MKGWLTDSVPTVARTIHPHRVTALIKGLETLADENTHTRWLQFVLRQIPKYVPTFSMVWWTQERRCWVAGVNKLSCGHQLPRTRRGMIGSWRNCSENQDSRMSTTARKEVIKWFRVHYRDFLYYISRGVSLRHNNIILFDPKRADSTNVPKKSSREMESSFHLATALQLFVDARRP